MELEKIKHFRSVSFFFFSFYNLRAKFLLIALRRQRGDSKGQSGCSWPDKGGTRWKLGYVINRVINQIKKDSLPACRLKQTRGGGGGSPTDRRKRRNNNASVNLRKVVVFRRWSHCLGAVIKVLLCHTHAVLPPARPRKSTLPLAQVAPFASSR